ncbi:MAG TPA: pseudouridine-5'-phosphate glycosidase [Pyrinomonadaceae bacterium]|nr:pseudouridine-5'-phosphate glycosidase [Pyrinomonadaceae bacterium]
MSNSELTNLSEEVRAALSTGQPVVALESTVIAHGLPRPQNVETARHLELIIRDAGVIPATIAILNGKICVGLDQNQLRRIGEDDNIQKISIRNLPIAIAQRCDGATTVAATLRIAHRADIRVFATGGIGGVHRGSLPDVSADLPELARTPMVVVCSGAKIVLDLAATHEWLETHGVSVIGYQCDEMPAFYSRRSGLKVDVRLDSPEAVAELFRTQRALGTESALLVTVPVPAEAEVPAGLLENVLENAVKEAHRRGIAGSELTPFLLSRMAEESEGITLRANIALLENNARVAAAIARTLDG